jgi:predicted nucleic acid-binding protein
MSILLDTNILTRSAEPQHPLYQVAADAVVLLLVQPDEPVLVPQNLYEFWVVCTRPVAQNGLGFSPQQAHAELSRLRTLYPLLDDTAALLPQWEQLVSQYQVVGKNAHDARLVAAMLVHGIGRLLTFNPADFQRFPGITVVTPQEVLASQTPGP